MCIGVRGLTTTLIQDGNVLVSFHSRQDNITALLEDFLVRARVDTTINVAFGCDDAINNKFANTSA